MRTGTETGVKMIQREGVKSGVQIKSYTEAVRYNQFKCVTAKDSHAPHNPKLNQPD